MLEIIYIIFMMLFLFGVTIFVHEWGHFYVARKCGLKVDAFAIGMGPSLYEKESNGVIYKICLFPIGGYVSLPQLDPAGMEKVQGNKNNKKTNILPDVSPWHKIAVAFAGPLCNVIFALLLGVIVSFGNHPEAPALVGKVDENSSAYQVGLRSGDRIIGVNGNPINSWYDAQVEALLGGNKFISSFLIERGTQTNTFLIETNNPEDNKVFINGVSEAIPCILGRVTPGSPAEVAGIQSEDIVKSYNNEPVSDWSHFTELVQSTADKKTPLIVERNGKTIELEVIPAFDDSTDRVLIGVALGGSLAMPWKLSGNPLEQIKSDTSSIIRLLKALTNSDEAKQAAGGLGGPVAIFTMIWYALKMGIFNALGLIRFININLAILNLLPLPVLDGGHIIFSLYEGISRKKVPIKVISILVNAFAILLISAMIFLSVRDVDRAFNVGRFFDKEKQIETNPMDLSE